MNNCPFLSIIVPVYNGGYPFIYCLLAIKKSTFKDWELIVVDDGCDDESAVIAHEFGAIVLETNGRLGPGAARNLGAKVAQGDYLCFIDADCEVHSNTLANLTQTLKCYPEVDALFGSYDNAPKASNFIAQYKNLFHHYVHQKSSEEASTFWAGCGAVKRHLFLELSGFDVERYQRPSIEDIDLGYRIKQAGGKIILAKHVQVKHHKAWNLPSLIKTDVLDRGIPWTQLLLKNQSHFINDLNLQTQSRVSVVAVYCLLISALAGFWKIESVLIAISAAVLLLYLNLEVYRFFYDQRGLSFSFRVIFFHWLYYFYSGIAFIVGTLLYWQDKVTQKIASPAYLK